MTPRLRKVVPFVAPLLLGAVGYLLVGEGPSSAPVRAGESADWALPAIAATDVSPAAPVWTARAPWGSEVAAADAAPEVAIRPVGVVAVGDSLFALFTQGDSVVRVPKGGFLADGGQVTAIRPDVVEWADAAGKVQRRELMVDIVAAGAAADSAAATPSQRGSRTGSRTGPRGATPSPRSTDGAARPAPTQREPGQRRARRNVPESGSEPFGKSRRPSTTGD